MTLAHAAPYLTPPVFVPEHDDERVGRELRRLRKEKFGERGSLAKVAKDADVSIALLGAIERGDHALVKVAQERVVRLAQAYGMTNEQFADLTGISIVAPVSDRRPNITMQPPEPIELPDLLREAIEQYGDRFPKLKEERWQRWLANTDFREEPENAETWLAVFLDFEKKINPR